MSVSDLDTFGKRFAWLLGKYKSDREFGRLADIDNNLIGKYKNDNGNPTLTNIEKICKVTGANAEWLINNKGEPYVNKSDDVEYTYKGKVNFKEAPVVSMVECGVPFSNWNFTEHKPILLPNSGHLHNPFFVIAKGDSMRPYINPKDLILCADVPFDSIKNRTAVVVSFKTEPDSVVANAKLFKRYDKERCMLYSVNTQYEPDIYEYKDIYKIYKVIEIRKPVA